MAERINEAKARKILKKFRSRIGKRNSRIHHETIASNGRRLQAINGICGRCPHLDIYAHGRGRSKTVQLFCNKGHNPESIHWEISVWDEANCPDGPK